MVEKRDALHARPRGSADSDLYAWGPMMQNIGVRQRHWCKAPGLARGTGLALGIIARVVIVVGASAKGLRSGAQCVVEYRVANARGNAERKQMSTSVTLIGI